MVYSFLVETYGSERLKTLNVWSMFRDEDLDVRPHPRLDRDRTAHEHMVHQCQSEDRWFRTMFDIDLGSPPLPETEARLAFIQRYAGLRTRKGARAERTPAEPRAPSVPKTTRSIEPRAIASVVQELEINRRRARRSIGPQRVARNLSAPVPALPRIQALGIPAGRIEHQQRLAGAESATLGGSEQRGPDATPTRSPVHEHLREVPTMRLILRLSQDHLNGAH